jgi:hypothetical protein
MLSARKGFFAFLPLIVTLFALLTAAWVGTFFVNPDMLRYECYGTAFWFGSQTSQLLPISQCQFIPQISQYHTLPLEYPPLTLIIFSLPLLVPGIGYPLVFALFMAAAVSVVYWVLIKYGPPGAGVFFAAFLLAGCLAIALARFDVIPAGLTLLCLVLAERKRWTLASMALALGVLIKLYPIVLFPYLFLAEQRDRVGFYIPTLSIPLKTIPYILLQTIRNMRQWRWKNALIFIGLLFGVTVLFWELISGGALGTFSYLFLRPYQVEATGSVLLWLASFLGFPVEWTNSFGSLNITSPIAGVVSTFFTILLCLGLIYIVIQQWKGKMDLLQATTAALLVLIASNKVFSPQYLIWLIPLLAYGLTSIRRVWLLWGGISILTTLIFPIGYATIANLNEPSLSPGVMAVILLRDALLVLLAIAYLFNYLNLRERNLIPIPACSG